MDKPWYHYSQYYLAIKRNELLVCAKTWINHKNHYTMKANKKKKREVYTSDSHIKFQILKANQASQWVPGERGGKWERDALLGVLERSGILTGVMVLQMYTYIRTNHTAHLKYVQFISLQYLNRVRWKMLRDIGNRGRQTWWKQTIKCYRGPACPWTPLQAPILSLSPNLSVSLMYKLPGLSVYMHAYMHLQKIQVLFCGMGLGRPK